MSWRSSPEIIWEGGWVRHDWHQKLVYWKIIVLKNNSTFQIICGGHLPRSIITWSLWDSSLLIECQISMYDSRKWSKHYSFPEMSINFLSSAGSESLRTLSVFGICCCHSYSQWSTALNSSGVALWLDWGWFSINIFIMFSPYSVYIFSFIYYSQSVSLLALPPPSWSTAVLFYLILTSLLLVMLLCYFCSASVWVLCPFVSWMGFSQWFWPSPPSRMWFLVVYGLVLAAVRYLCPVGNEVQHSPHCSLKPFSTRELGRRGLRDLMPSLQQLLFSSLRPEPQRKLSPVSGFDPYLFCMCL